MKIAILSGAGISAESGIRTFRDSNGLWEEYPVEAVASIDGYNRNPELVLKFYNERRKQLKDVRPNAAHLAVKRLEEKHEVVVITQNVDNLHEQAGSSNIIHLHGELLKATSSDNPNNPVFIRQLNVEDEISFGDLADDGSQLRPYIVWFGEAVPAFSKAIDEVKSADMVIVIGTSFNVYPAASLVQFAKKDSSIYVIDPNPTQVPQKQNITILPTTATLGMQQILKELGLQ